MTNKNHTTLYVGVTADLLTRVIQHRDKYYPNSFSARYNLTKLVYFKAYPNIEEAIAEEKRIKAGTRKKKLELINSVNPKWMDLFKIIKNW